MCLLHRAKKICSTTGLYVSGSRLYVFINRLYVFRIRNNKYPDTVDL